jgi:hypothetical protein
MIPISTENDVPFRRLQQHFGGDITFTLKRLELLVSKMIMFGGHKYVEEYIGTSPEAKLFLHGVLVERSRDTEK